MHGYEQPKNGVPCLLCCEPESGRIKISNKTGRFYVRCNSCSSMIFLNSQRAFMGYSILAPYVSNMVAQFRKGGGDLNESINKTMEDARVIVEADQKAGSGV